MSDIKDLKKISIKIGVDEAGRGPLAGPVFACALWVANKKTVQKIFQNIKDSKKLSVQKRLQFYQLMKLNRDIVWCTSRVGERVIDRINIFKATKLAMSRAVMRLVEKIEKKHKIKKFNVYVLIDGNFKIDIPYPQKSIVKGDEKVFQITLASIVAKVERDKFMKELHRKYPQYGFDRHKGYGTREHFEKLKKLGPSPRHRKSFTLEKN